jgi:hypothetical protein
VPSAWQAAKGDGLPHLGLSDRQKPSAKIIEMSEVDFSNMPLPPASFTFLVLSLRTQVEMQLGLLQFGEEEKREPDLTVARHTIDMLGMLLEKTKGNLDMDEHRLLENSLTELRFRFVQVSDEVAKAEASKA